MSGGVWATIAESVVSKGFSAKVGLGQRPTKAV